MATSFTTPLLVEVLPQNRYRLLAGFDYRMGREDSPVVITVPADFVTDFASVPRIFWPLISPSDSHAKAAVLHDCLYRVQPCSRLVADALFMEALEVLEVPGWKRYCLFYGVRIGGKPTWNKRKRERLAVTEQ